MCVFAVILCLSPPEKQKHKNIRETRSKIGIEHSLHYTDHEHEEHTPKKKSNPNPPQPKKKKKMTATNSSSLYSWINKFRKGSEGGGGGRDGITVIHKILWEGNTLVAPHQSRQKGN